MTLIPSSTPPLPDAIGRRMPLLKFLLPLVGGIVLAWTCKDMINRWAWLIAALIFTITAIAAIVGKRKWNGWTSAIAMTLALICIAGAWSMQRYNEIVTHWPQNEQVWLGQVEQIKKIKESHTTVIVEIKSDKKQYHQKRIQVSLQGNETLKLQSGTNIAFKARINEKNRPGNPGDFDYATYLLQHGLSGSAYCHTAQWQILTIPTTSNWHTRFLHLRQKLVNQYAKYFHDTDLSLLAALTLGDKSLLTTETQQLFSDTGTSHVLALSGLHIGILISLFNLLLLKRLRYGWKHGAATLILLAALWGFVLLAGAPLSLLRAALMFSFMQVAQSLQRIHSLSLNNLALAALLLLIIDPFTLFDVGFQLSFTAVFFIISSNDYLWQRHRLPFWKDDIYHFNTPRREFYTAKAYFRYFTLPSWKYRIKKHSYKIFRSVLIPFICISLSAQWGTTPLILHYFHTLAPYAWLANFMVIPAAYILLSAALLFLLLPFSFIQVALAKVIEWTLHLLTQGLQAISEWPFATERVYATSFTLVCIWLVPILLFFFFEKRKTLTRKSLLISSVALLIISIGAETFSTLTIRRITPRICVYKATHTSLIHFIQSNAISYLLSSTTADSTRLRMTPIEQNFFMPNHIASPTLITQSQASYPTLQRAKGLFLFHHKRIVYLNLPFALNAIGPIDLLIVAKGSPTNATQWLANTSVRQVVLDGSLTSRQRKVWAKACRATHIPCHDVLQQGAFIWTLP